MRYSSILTQRLLWRSKKHQSSSVSFLCVEFFLIRTINTDTKINVLLYYYLVPTELVRCYTLLFCDLLRYSTVWFDKLHFLFAKPTRRFSLSKITESSLRNGTPSKSPSNVVFGSLWTPSRHSSPCKLYKK